MLFVQIGLSVSRNHEAQIERHTEPFTGEQDRHPVGLSVFCIHVWSSHFPPFPPLIAVRVHFTEVEFPYLVLVFHLACVGGLAEPVF